jgi:aryl-phospho-beta-D-glucosidase BglC (GH1 family)
MRGVNWGGWFSQIDAIAEKTPGGFPGKIQHIRTFLGEEDAVRVAGWGFDHIRLPVDWFNAFDPGFRPEEEVLRLLDDAVDRILGSGLGLILDLHKSPGHDFLDGTVNDQALFFDEGIRRSCLRIWACLAERYGSKAGIILEPLNEPVAPSSDAWNAVKDVLAAEIRRMAPKATILIGSNLWNSAQEFGGLTPIDDDNAVYSFHFYNPLVFTHQKAPWVPSSSFKRSLPYPGTYPAVDGATDRLKVDAGRWDKARLEEELEPVIRFRERYGLPVACNEFGVYMGGPDSESRMAWIRDLLAIFRENGIGWSYWNYKSLDFGIISEGEELFAEAPQYDNIERTDYPLLDILKSG